MAVDKQTLRLPDYTYIYDYNCFFLCDYLPQGLWKITAVCLYICVNEIKKMLQINMKKIFTTRFCLMIALFLLSSMTVTGQGFQVPNSSFENFEDDALNKVGKRPVSWNTSNITKTVIGLTVAQDMVFEEANGRTGKCVKMVNTKVGAAGITEVSPSWTTLGKPWSYIDGINTGSATAGTDGGIQFTHRPDTLSVWIKRTFGGSERENAHIVFYSWKGTSRGDSYKNKDGGCSNTQHFDEESDIRRTVDGNECGTPVMATQIGEGMWRNDQTFATWTEIKVPITYYNNEIPEKMNIILSAANYPNFRANTVLLNSTLFADDLKLIYSSKAHEILLNNRKMPGFTPEQTTYSYSLGANAATVPTITLKRSGRLLDPSEYTINYGAVGEETTITVRAEDGSSQTTYSITFLEQLSNNPRPADIKVDGVSIQGFQPYVYNYNVELPYGTTAVPAVTIVEAEDGQTFSVANPASLPGAATVTVTAPDGATTQTYTINYTVGVLKDNTLTDIRVNGKTITGFSPTKNSYVVELPMGTVDDPVIEYTTAYPSEHVVVVDNQGLNGTSTIKVTPRGTTNTRTYSLRFVITASTYSYLQMIKIGGVNLEGFVPETMSYSVNLPLGTTDMPAITWTPGDEYQNVVLENGGLDGTTKITVTSQSGAVSIYRITFSTAKSSVSTLQSLMVDGVEIVGFDPETVSYVVNLGVGVTAMPAITWVAGDEYQTITFVNGGLTGTSRVVVKAQDGTVKTYSIKFNVSESSVSTLLDIQVGGVSIVGFASDVFTYDIQLPRGTTALPDITWTVADALQTVRKVEGGVNGETRITVKAQSGVTSIYTLRFSVETNSNVKLNDIQIDGVSIENFHTDTLDYEYLLPSGTTSLPLITFEKADASQNVMINRNGVNGITYIVVTAEDRSTRTYSIKFSVEKSENAFIQMIYVDGTPLEGFVPEQLTYDYTIPYSADRCPVFTVDKEAGQDVNIIAPRVDGNVRIEVVPEAGSANVYVVNVHFPQSDNADLQTITVGGEEITGFQSDKYEYDIVLPQGTAALPAIDYVKGDATQSVFVERNGVNGISHIYVTAESGRTVDYKLGFSVQRSSLSALTSIKVDGVEIAGFSSSVNSYDYVLPYSAEALPTVTYEKESQFATVECEFPALEGTARLMVVSEDKSDTTIYNITFAKEVSDNVDLQQIAVNGTVIPLSQFVVTTVDANASMPAVAQYMALASMARTPAVIEQYAAVVDLPSGSASPEVTYVGGDVSQSVIEAHSGLKGSELIVVAANGAMRKYVITYNMVSATTAYLSDIQIATGLNNSVSVDGFEPTKFDYTYTLPWRTKSVPVIVPKTAQKVSSIEIDYNGINETTVITVVSEDGLTEQKYNIAFEVEKSAVNTLDAIYLDGSLVPGFDANGDSFDVELPYGTTELPDITWDLAMANDGSLIEEQSVELTVSSIYEPATIKVVAESGAEHVYTINFTVASPGKANELLLVTVGDVPVPLSAGKYDYDVTLPYGTTAVPAVSVIKSYPEQRIITKTVGGVNGVVEIEVVDPDPAVAKAVYSLNLSVAGNTLSLSTVSVDGVPFTRYNPEQLTYILPVTEKPEITYTVKTGISAEVVDDESEKMTQIKVVDDVTMEGRIYTFYFYYTNDVIPNGEFKDWSPTKYNGGQKPTGWMAPADAAESVSAFFVKYSTGSEVSKSGEYLKLKSIYHTTLAGSVPGMVTIGTMTMELKVANTTTSSVSGGIVFRNTPDNVMMRYNPVKQSNGMKNIRFLMTSPSLSNTLEYEDPTFNDTWKIMNESLVWDNSKISSSNLMNITINCSHSETASAIGGVNRTSEMLVEYVRFAYNNSLAGIKVDGVDVDGFNVNTLTYNVALDAEYAGLPKIETIGAVEDQEHRIAWSDWSNDAMTATITSVAENGDEKVYSINFTKPQSANAYLAGLYVNGTILDGFAADKLNYTYSVPNLTKVMPDVMAMAGSQYQTIAITLQDNVTTVVVRAENGEEKQYAITFVEEKSDVALLANIEVADHAIAFDAATRNYSVDMAEGEQLPVVSFAKSGEGQSVVYKSATPESPIAKLVVTAENGVDTAMYNVQFNIPAVAQTSALTSIAVNGEALAGFNASVYDYSVESAGESNWYFTVGSVSDRVVERIADDRVEFVMNGGAATYAVSITAAVGAEAELATLRLDGEQLAEFSATGEEYQRDMANATPIRLGAWVAKEGKVSVEYSVEGDVRKVVYSVLSEDSAATRNVVVEFGAVKLSNTELGDIRLNGSSIATSASEYTSSAAFDADVTDYDIVLESATPKEHQPVMPTIDVVAGDSRQQITVERGGIASATYITVKAESGAERVYTLNFDYEKSSNTDLANILVDSRPVEGFDASKYRYEINVTDEVSDVRAVRGDAFQTVNVSSVGDSTIIDVRAEDGSDAEYVIVYKMEKSAVATLGSILSDGVEIAGFQSDRFDYQYDLPVGVMTLPQISVVSGDDGQSVSISKDNESGLVTIHVVSEDGSESNDYRVQFIRQLSENADLSMIYVDGAELVVSSDRYTASSAFDASVRNYTITLPVGTRVNPIITWEAGDAYQNVTSSVALDGTVTISVVAENPYFTNEYVIDFDTLRSKNALLGNIYIDGEPLADFKADNYNYVVELPVGTAVVPSVMWAQGDDWQTVRYTEAADVNGTAVIEVLAEDSVYTSRYTVKFNRLKSNNTELSSIYLDGELIDGFASDSYNYSVVLPVGSTGLPVITWETSDEWQQVDSVVYDNLTIITVTSESGASDNYFIHFTTEKSNNAYLDMIFVGGEPINGFDMEIVDYVVTLPYGTVSVPAVHFEAAEPEVQKIAYTPALSVADTAVIVVKAEDRVATMTYRVSFEIGLSDNAYLKSITIGGEPISTKADGFESDADFAKEQYMYSIVLPYGTTELPEIAWEGEVADYSSITMVEGGITGITTITVESQDGMNVNEYVLDFSVRKNDNALLDSLNVGDGLIKEFSRETFEYTITFPIGTTEDELPTADDVVYVVSDEGQSVSVSQTDPYEIVVMVTAEDGMTVKVYVIKFVIEKSGNSLLADILINGISIENFSPTNFDYTYLVYPGAAIPTLEGVRGEETQTVSVTMGAVNEVSYIYVDAEDGTSSEYRITFATTTVNPGDRPSRDDVAFTALGDGYFQAASKRDNVRIIIYQANGAMVRNEVVGLVDPNDDLLYQHDGGTVLYFNREGKCYIYAFVYDNQVILSGKFIR